MKKEKQVRAKGNAVAIQTQAPVARLPEAVSNEEQLRQHAAKFLKLAGEFSVQFTPPGARQASASEALGIEWLRIPLSKLESAVLSEILPALWREGDANTRGETARLLLLAMMAHFGDFNLPLWRDAQYAIAEGIEWQDYFDQVMRRRFRIQDTGAATAQAGKGGAI